VDLGQFFYIVITIYYLLALFTFLQTIIFYHSMRLILSLQQTGEIDNLTISWGKVLGCVVCRFYIAAGAKLRPRRGVIYKLSGAVAKLASINLQKLVLSPASSINLGFILREDLLLCSSYLPLGVPSWVVIYTPSLGSTPRGLPLPVSTPRVAAAGEHAAGGRRQAPAIDELLRHPLRVTAAGEHGESSSAIENLK
jgi:hypothetical protein